MMGLKLSQVIIIVLSYHEWTAIAGKIIFELFHYHCKKFDVLDR